MKDTKAIIIFDGVCNFCNSSVNFIISRDPNSYFSFAPMQGHAAKNILKHHNIENTELKTFLLIKSGKIYQRTDAALEITKDLSGYWKLFRVFLIIPSPVRDVFYRLLANNRYKLFGKNDQCMIPTPELKNRFLE